MEESTLPFVSVIIPTYNRAKMISRCLDSVLEQTFSPNEVIIVDNGSVDETFSVIQNYHDPRIHYLKLEENRGAQVARNYGISMSHGSWIAFLDSDDEWLPSKLEKQIQALAEVDFDPFTVVHTNATVIETATGRELSFNLAFEGKNIYTDLLCNFGPMFQGMLVSYQALEKIDFLDEKVPSFQEWDTAIRLAKYCKFKYLAEPLFIYNLHGEERISNDNQLWIDGYSYVIHKFKKDIIKFCGEQKWEQHLDILEQRKEGFYSSSHPEESAKEKKNLEIKPRIAIFMAEWILLSTSGNTALMLAENGYEVDFFLYQVDTKYFNLNNIAGINVYDFSECINDAPLLPDTLIRATTDILKKNSYRCLIGIERMGLIWAGMVNEFLQAPLIYLNLELYTTIHKNYTGDRFHLAKKAEREYHQTAAATIVQDLARAKVLLEDNEIANSELLLVPVSVIGNRFENKGNYLQRRFSFLEGKRIILYFGELWESRYVVELANAALKFPENWVAVMHCGGSSVPESLKEIINSDLDHKIVISLDCLPQDQVGDVISSADIGVAFYSDSYHNPYLTGSASEKLALYLQSGLPVITFNYPSFTEIVEKYRCGICIPSFELFQQAIERIFANYDEYKKNAAKCFTDHYEFRSQFDKVLKFIEKFK